MSGFIVAFGGSTESDVARLAAKLAHRGMALSGTAHVGKAVLYQGYLEADLSADSRDHSDPPLADQSGTYVCFDGRLGSGGGDRAYDQEKRLLASYADNGAELAGTLSDSVFAFVITDGTSLLAARDSLGVKPLYYGYSGETLFFASELKALVDVVSEPHEFPAGAVMDENSRIRQYADLSEYVGDPYSGAVEDVVKEIRTIVNKTVESRVTFRRPTACLLSGGLDSSIIAAVTTAHRKRAGGMPGSMMSFAIGVGESGDIRNARVMASHIGTDHHEVIVTVEEMVAELPAVIRALESFDPSLVRSAAANFMISRYAAEHGIEVLMSGEGGDELFAGYTHLKEVAPERLADAQVEVIGRLHNNASLRLDRMNQANSIRVIAPLVSEDLLRLALSLPAEWKIGTMNGAPMEKWVLRKAFENDLPPEIAWRPKKEFSQGSGSADALSVFFDDRITDDELREAQQRTRFVRSKEELYYYRLFEETYPGEHSAKTVGQWPDF